jgi:hypothetical protein
VQLKHIILNFEWGFGHVFKALETTSLSAHKFMRVPKMHLPDLPSLRFVALHSALPARISVPEDCKSHISGLDSDRFHRSSQAQAASLEKVSSLQICGKDMVALNLGSAAANTVLFCWIVFANVQDLYIGGVDVRLSVPSLSWQSLEVVTSDSIEIIIVDVEAFASNIKTCVCRYDL